MGENCEKEYWGGRCDEDHSPQGSAADETLGVIEVAVNTGISELGLLIEEKVAVEPAKLA